MLDRRRLLQGAAMLSLAPLSGLSAQEKRTLSIVTGGTGGVSYLRKMLDVVLFPEIWRLRTNL